MDIRIGNDVQVLIPVNTFGDVNPQNIKFMTCTFYKNEEHDCKNEIPLPIFHHSSQYTVHGCGIPVYDVLPSDHHRCLHDIGPHSCGHIVSKPNLFVAICKVNNGNITAVFPAEFQNEEGVYSCRFDIKVYEENWDIDNLHSYSSVFKNVVNITSSDEGQYGSVIIELSGCNNFEKLKYYIGSVDKSTTTFENLTVEKLLNESVVLEAFDNEDVTMKDITCNNQIFYIMIPKNSQLNEFYYTNGCDKNLILSYNLFNVSHEDVMINGVLYKIYAYFNYVTNQNNPLQYIFRATIKK